MDPLSNISAIASILQRAYTTCGSVYRDLASELASSIRALSAIDEALKSPTIVDTEKRGPPEENDQLWRAVRGALEDYRETISSIDSALESVKRKGSTWAKQAIRQVKLNSKAEEIVALRARTHTHCCALQMALQMINIRVAYLTPVVVLADLGPKIERLQDSLDCLGTSLEEQRRDVAHASAKVGRIDSANTLKLQSLAMRLLSKASTIQGSTIAGGSLLDEPVATETRLRTMSWIPKPSVPERPVSFASAAQSSGHLSVEQEPPVNPQLTGTTLIDEPDLAEPDSEEEFEFEVAQKLLDEGKKSFKLEDYKKAVGYLQKGVTRSNGISTILRAKLGLEEVPIMIATCKYHLDELDQAEADLIVLVRQESTNDQDAVCICQVSHILSQIYLIKDQLEDAERHCRNSMNGRRRLLGKEHGDYYASLGLLSEICNAQGNIEEAAVYNDMIPLELASLRKKVRSQEYLSKISQTPISSPPSPTTSPRSPIYLASETQSVSLPSSICSDPDLLLAFGSQSGNLRLWDIETGLLWAKHDAPKQSEWRAAFTPDFQSVALRSAGSLVTYNFVLGSKSARRLSNKFIGQRFLAGTPRTNPVSYIQCISKDCRLVAAEAKHGVAVSDQLADPFLLQIPECASGERTESTIGITALSFSSDNRLLASGQTDGTVRIWIVATGKLRSTLHIPGCANVLAFSPTGELVACGSFRALTLWDTLSATTHKSIEMDATVCAIAFSSDATRIAIGLQNGLIELRATQKDVSTSDVILEGHSDYISSLAFSPDGINLASASFDQTLRVWDWREAKGKIYTQFGIHWHSFPVVGFVSKGVWSKAKWLK